MYIILILRDTYCFVFSTCTGVVLFGFGGNPHARTMLIANMFAYNLYVFAFYLLDKTVHFHHLKLLAIVTKGSFAIGPLL